MVVDGLIVIDEINPHNYRIAQDLASLREQMASVDNVERSVVDGRAA
jgi:hypothetical protein